MTTLLLRLAGPLQSWGVDSKYTRRMAGTEPSKSGVIGMLAAARGIDRADELSEDLLQLRFGVRSDQPGTVIRDFQTAVRENGTSMPLSERYYLSDAMFLAAIESDRDNLEHLRASLMSPKFPLYLGRRSCPPVQPLVMGIVEDSLVAALEKTEWLVPEERRKRREFKHVPSLAVSRDLIVGEDPADGDRVRDEPESFDPQRRRHGWRAVKRYRVSPPGLEKDSLPEHEPEPFGD